MCKKSITFLFTVIECRNAGYVRNDLMEGIFWEICGIVEVTKFFGWDNEDWRRLEDAAGAEV